MQYGTLLNHPAARINMQPGTVFKYKPILTKPRKMPTEQMKNKDGARAKDGQEKQLGPRCKVTA